MVVLHVPGTRMPGGGPPPRITHLTVPGFVGNRRLTPHAFPVLDVIAILMKVSGEGAAAFELPPQPAPIATTTRTAAPVETARLSIFIP